YIFFYQAEDGIRVFHVTGVQTCALPIFELIDAQYNLKKTRGQKNAKSLVILVNGIELAGKGEAVKQLREWVDPRYLRVKADKSQLAGPKQTLWQPYARFIPAEGQIMVLFGNWYSDLLGSAMQA